MGAEVFLSYSALALVLGRLFACKLQGETFFSILAFPEMPVISISHSVQSPESRQVFYSSSVQPIYILYKCRVGDGEGNGTPLQYSCLENPMDGGAW